MATADRVQTQTLKKNPSTRQSRHGKLTRLAWLTWGGAILFVVLLVAVFAVFQYLERDQIRTDIVVFGVNVGGMTDEEARAAVLAETEARASSPLILVDGDQTWELTQREVGLRFDVDAAVAEAFDEGRSGFGPDRLALLWHLKQSPTTFGPGHVAVATDATQAVLMDLADDIYLPTIQPEFSIDDDGTYHYTAAQTGRELDIDTSLNDIVQALTNGEETLDLSITEYPPVAHNDAYAAVLTKAENALDGPITLRAGDQVYTFEPGQISSRLIFVPPSATQPANLALDDQWAIRLIDEIGWAIDRQPQSPRVWWDSAGQLVVMREPQPGYQIRAGEALELVRDVFSGEVNMNDVELPVDVILPPALPQDLTALGLNGVIAESSTPYGGGSVPERMHNIELAARLLNGVLIMPGQTFSFNSEIGPMTEDAGFQIAYGIVNNDGELRTIPTEAGGICQVATTVFQPVFATGYEITQRSTHSYWIESYTYQGFVGLDATVDPASGLDLKWVNNSEHAVLIQAQADGENFNVRLIGQAPNWQVEVHEPVVTDIQWADTETVHYETDESLEPGEQIRVERAQNGFDVEVARTVTYPDGAQGYWMDEVTYGKARNVVLVGPDEPAQPDGEQTEGEDAP